MEFAVLVGILAVAALVFGVLSYRNKRRTEAAGGIPSGKETAYAQGMAPGADGVPLMYTLITCRHCVHLKEFLSEHGIAHHTVFVDDFLPPARTELMRVLRGYNPRGSFPTLVLPGGKTLTGFREREVRAAFGLPEQEA